MPSSSHLIAMCSHYVKKSDSNSLAAHCARVVPGNPYVALELAPEKGCLTIQRYWRPRPWSHLRKAVLAALAASSCV